jgi:hypothetical protein
MGSFQIFALFFPLPPDKLVSFKRALASSLSHARDAVLKAERKFEMLIINIRLTKISDF